MTGIEYRSNLRNELPRYFHVIDGTVTEVVVACSECDETWTYDAQGEDSPAMIGTRADADVKQHARETASDDEPGHHSVDVGLDVSTVEEVVVDISISTKDEEPE